MINDKQNVGIIVNAEILENLKRLAQKAVPGPWSVDSLGNIFREPHAIDEDWQPIVLLTKSSLGEYAPAEANAAYIAALSPDVALALVDEIERLNKEIKSLREIENGLSEDNFSLSSQYVEDNKKIAQLEKEAAWLAQYCECQDQCPYLALNWEYNPPDWCQCTDTIEEGFDCYMNPIECWREAARNAIAQGNANDRQ